jgi:predicted nucleic acid-binding protein
VIVLDTSGLLAALDAAEVAEGSEVLGRYGDLRLGLADASVVVIAGAARTTRVLTLDERHFRPVRPLWGEAFTLLPADQS